MKKKDLYLFLVLFLTTSVYGQILPRAKALIDTDTKLVTDEQGNVYLSNESGPKKLSMYLMEPNGTLKLKREIKEFNSTGALIKKLFYKDKHLVALVYDYQDGNTKYNYRITEFNLNDLSIKKEYEIFKGKSLEELYGDDYDYEVLISGDVLVFVGTDKKITKVSKKEFKKTYPYIAINLQNQKEILKGEFSVPTICDLINNKGISLHNNKIYVSLITYYEDGAWAKDKSMEYETCVLEHDISTQTTRNYVIKNNSKHHFEHKLTVDSDGVHVSGFYSLNKKKSKHDGIFTALFSFTDFQTPIINYTEFTDENIKKIAWELGDIFIHDKVTYVIGFDQIYITQQGNHQHRYDNVLVNAVDNSGKLNYQKNIERKMDMDRFIRFANYMSMGKYNVKFDSGKVVLILNTFEENGKAVECSKNKIAQYKFEIETNGNVSKSQIQIPKNKTNFGLANRFSLITIDYLFGFFVNEDEALFEVIKL